MWICSDWENIHLYSGNFSIHWFIYNENRNMNEKGDYLDYYFVPSQLLNEIEMRH